MIATTHRNGPRSWSALIFATLVSLSATACGAEYGGLDLSLSQLPPDGSGVLLTQERIRIPLGLAVSVKALPRSRSVEQYEDNVEIRLQAEDLGVATVYPTSKPFHFIITAGGVGQSWIHVFVDREQVDRIPIEVPNPPR